MRAGLEAELAPGLRVAVGPPQRAPRRISSGEPGAAGRAARPPRRRRPRPGAGSFSGGGRDAGDPREVGEQAVEGEVAPAEDVALARARRARRRAGGRSATSRTSTMLSAAVDVGRDPAEAEAAHQTHRGPRRIVGAEDEGRVDDHHRQPARGEPERLELGLVLGVDVGDPEVADLERRRLVGGRRSASRPRSPRRSTCARRRSTPASSASSKTIRAPRRLASKTASRSAARSEVRPATWKTRSTPSIARRTARRSVMSPVARSNSMPVEVAEVGAAAGEQRAARRRARRARARDASRGTRCRR